MREVCSVKKYKKILVIGLIILFISIVALSVQLSKNLQPEEALTEDFFKNETNLRLEKINDMEFKDIDASSEIQNEVKRLVKKLKLKRTDRSFGPFDAEYVIVSKKNQEDQLYLFVDESVIVFPNKSMVGYKIKNNEEFMKTIDTLLK